MKKFSLWINIVLVVAVAGLYVLYFTGNKKQAKEVINEETGQTIDREYTIAFVNIDTLITKYDMYLDKVEELKLKHGESEAELQIKSKELDSELQKYRSDVSKGLITRTKAQMIEQDLGKKQQELYARGEYLQRALYEEEQVMNRQVLNSIMEYLKEYNKEHNYRYILSNSFGGPFLYTDNTLNITYDVLSGINENYAKEKTTK